MPPTVRTDKNKIVDAAIAIIEESGAVGVTARMIAAKLGISTQPIYREFADMNEVLAAAVNRGWEIFSEYMKGEALDRAVGYVVFAMERSNLFNFLFRGKHYEYTGLDDLSHKLVGTEIIDILEKVTGLPREKVYRVHLVAWMALHGLATISADNMMAIDREEVSMFVKDITLGMAQYYGK